MRRLLALAFIAVTFVGPALAQKPGTHDLTMTSGGTEREYRLIVPKGYSAKQKKSVPLVLMLHGRTGNGKNASSAYYGWSTLAKKEKFFAVFPTALGNPTSWKGAWRGRPTEDSVFLDELIDHLLETFKIDPDRVFMTGHSSGGFMSFSFAQTHSEKIAAIGPVAGLLVGGAKPKTPVSLISFHGMADDVVKYGDPEGKSGRSAVGSAAFFAKHAKAKKQEREDIKGGKVHVDTWSGGQKGTEVVLYSIEGGDHGWPRRTVDATALIWDFFKEHPRGGQKKKRRR